MTAWAPDLTHQSSAWVVVWAPQLYRYTSNGWVKYLSGPVQTESGVDGGDGWSSDGWIVQSFSFTNLPTGYYQVRDTYAWLYNGLKTGAYGVLQPVTHKLDGVSYYYGASYWTSKYSTSSYCYMS